MHTTTSNLQSELSKFQGTDGYHKLTMFGGFVCTDGTRYFAEEGKAFWALDLIASYQMESKIRNEEFQHWKISSKEGRFCATCEDGNGKVLSSQKGSTDLEPGEYRFFLTGKVLMLPNEY